MTECAEYMKKNNLRDSHELALYLIKNVGIATVPCSSFYAGKIKGKTQTRFCFCKKRETLDKAINLIKTISE
jgi:aminotransferase